METSDNFEEVLTNIEVFCRVLVDKMSGVRKSYVRPEPIEKLLRKKAVIEVSERSAEGREPLIDLFEDEKHVRILALMQPLFGNEVTFNSNNDFTEIVVGKYLKIKIPIKTVDVSKIHVNNNNRTLEIMIEKPLPLITCISN